MKYIQCCAFEHKWSKGINVVVYSVAAILLSQQKLKKLQHKFPLNPKLPICSTPIQYKSIQKHLKFRDHFPPLHSQDLVIIPLLGLLEEPLSSLQAFFYLAVILAVLCSRLVVLNSWKIKRHRMESSLLTHPKVANGKWSALFIRQSFSGSEHTCFKTLLLANMYPPEVSLSKAVKPPMSRGNVISPRLFFPLEPPWHQHFCDAAEFGFLFIHHSFFWQIFTDQSWKQQIRWPRGYCLDSCTNDLQR